MSKAVYSVWVDNGVEPIMHFDTRDEAMEFCEDSELGCEVIKMILAGEL